MIGTRKARVALLVAGTLFAGVFSSAARADSIEWEAFTIRELVSPSTALTVTESLSGKGVTANIDEGGEKAGYGTSAFDGQNVSVLQTLTYSRLDAGTKDPYVNIWVSDGTNYAVIAPVANMTASGGYTSNDVNGLNLQTLGFNIYETNFANLNWLVPGAQRVNSALISAANQVITLADIGHLKILDPGVYPNPPVGTGAPKNGTGFNIVFGDTQGNFVSPLPYHLENVDLAASAAPVPLPAAAWAGMALMGGLGITKKLRGRAGETA